MTYEELLRKPQWHEKCHKILSRDGFRCKKCGANGYHADFIKEFNHISEIDSCIEGLKINGLTLSEFILDELNCEHGLSFPTMLWKEEPNEWHGFKMYKCGAYVSFGNAALIRTKQRICTYEEDMYNLEAFENGDFAAKVRAISSDGITASLPNGLDTNLESITSVIFKTSLSDNPVLAIERVPNTGGYASLTGYFCSWGSIVISVTYRNCVVSIYLNDQRHYEINKDGQLLFNKPLDTSIGCRGLNVHHKYYIKGKLPWDYEDDALITLCESCHKLTHKENKTPIYRSIIPTITLDSYAQVCDRCGGGGYLPQYDYYCNGVCFKCWGEGVVLD